MDASVETVDGDIVLKFRKFLLEEAENEISFGQNFIYEFSDTFGELHVSNRGKAFIDLSTGEVMSLPETGDDNNI